MEQPLANVIPLLVGLVTGLALGGSIVWVFARSRIESVRIETRAINDVELTRLQERYSSLAIELDRERQKVALLQSSNLDTQNQLNTAVAECAQVTERANRVPVLESEITVLQQRLDEEIIRARNQSQNLNTQVADLGAKAAFSDSTVKSQVNQIEALSTERAQLIAKRDQLLGDQQILKAEVAKLTTALNAEREQMAEKLSLLESAKEQLSDTFKALANDILEEKANKFTEHNNTNLGQILEPLRTKLQEFQAKVDQIHVNDTRDRSDLAAQVRQLMTLSERVSDDAKNLACALKGSNKTQGNWGELVLERVLEVAGLIEGRDYKLQQTHKREDGSRARPDVIINLPEGRHLVVDSKVSLTDYEQYVSATSDEDKESAVERHVASVRRHMKDLSEKNYQELYSLNTLDFVIMFVPIESAFAMAIAQDSSLWDEAWNKNVLLVSPSTLLFVLRTVAYLWRQEDQARNVQDIAERGAELYNKLVGFVEDLDKLDDRLRQARDTFDSAYKKLATGHGNVIRQAEMLKDLGVRPTKILPPDLVEASKEEPSIVRTMVASVGMETAQPEIDVKE